MLRLKNLTHDIKVILDIERHYAAVDEGWGSTVGEPEVFARWGTRLADRRHGSGYKDPEPGTWRRFLQIPKIWKFCE